MSLEIVLAVHVFLRVVLLLSMSKVMKLKFMMFAVVHAWESVGFRLGRLAETLTVEKSLFARKKRGVGYLRFLNSFVPSISVT